MPGYTKNPYCIFNLVNIYLFGSNMLPKAVTTVTLISELQYASTALSFDYDELRMSY
jgi:hypothetical protein